MSLSNSQLSTLNFPLIPPGYKQTEVGIIPEDWEADNLGRFWGVTDCKHVTAQFVPLGFPLASIREVQSRFVDLTNAKQTTAHFYNLLIEGGRKPRPGDLILSRNATVGEVAQVADWHPPFAMGQDVCLLRKKSNEHSTEFLQSIFQSPVILKQLADLMVGSTFKRANILQIRNFAVPMPPPREQQTIATALSDVDALIAGLDQLITKKRDLKQAAMQQLLTGQTRLPGFCGEWEQRRLGECASFRTGPFGSALHKSDYTEDGIPIVNPMHIVDGNIEPTRTMTITEQAANNLTEFRLKTGEIVIGRRGDMGRCAVVKAHQVGWLCGTGSMIIRCVNNADAEFLQRVLSSPQAISAIEDASVGTTMINLNQSTLAGLRIQLPPLHEQTAIAQVLTDMDAELAGLEQRRDKTRALKQAMMQELLTGKTRLI